MDIDCISPDHSQNQSLCASSKKQDILDIHPNEGDDGAYWAVRQGAALFDLRSWCILTATGSDRKSFLHGMLTNDVKGLRSGEGNYTLFLTAKGKIQADLWLFDRGGDCLLLTPDRNGPVLQNGLDQYLITEDVVLIDSSKEWALFSLQGPRSQEILSNVFENIEIPKNEYGYATGRNHEEVFHLLRVSHLGEVGFDVLIPREQGPAVWSKLVQAGAFPAGLDRWNTARIEAGIPLCGVDLDENVIPQEASLHHALHFKKGCYLGQEVVARLHFRGHVNRELTGFLLGRDFSPQRVCSLYHEGTEVGKLTSACYSPWRKQWIGLGFLRCQFRDPGTGVMVKDGMNEYFAEITSLPFVPGKGIDHA